MAVGSIILPSDVNNTGKHEATRTKTDTDGQLKHFPRTLIEPDRIISNRVAVTTPRTLGAAALTHNIFSLENTAASAVILAVRRVSIQLDATVALTTVAPTIKASRITTMPTGGTQLTKILFDTAPPASPATVIARAATSADGAAATAITATAGTTLWSQLTMRLHTAVGQVLMDDASGIPSLCEDDPLILRPGQALLLQVVATATGSNPATNHWVVNCMFEEFTEF
jgi:hypothetical protein